jgi:hypothetical protein
VLRFTPSGPSTVSALDSKTTSLRIGVPCVELVLYPMGGGLLVFHIDWLPTRNKKLSVDELRRCLSLFSLVSDFALSIGLGLPRYMGTDGCSLSSSGIE